MQEFLNICLEATVIVGFTAILLDSFTNKDRHKTATEQPQDLPQGDGKTPQESLEVTEFPTVEPTQDSPKTAPAPSVTELRKLVPSQVWRNAQGKGKHMPKSQMIDWLKTA